MGVTAICLGQKSPTDYSFLKRFISHNCVMTSQNMIWKSHLCLIWDGLYGLTFWGQGCVFFWDIFWVIFCMRTTILSIHLSHKVKTQYAFVCTRGVLSFALQNSRRNEQTINALPYIKIISTITNIQPFKMDLDKSEIWRLKMEVSIICFYICTCVFYFVGSDTDIMFVW